ncbi:MAG: ACT domain-containing protein [Microthrixaceae bacterium]|nr:ACT domain-containing protein [Microthrixaceae bacterium]
MSDDSVSRLNALLGNLSPRLVDGQFVFVVDSSADGDASLAIADDEVLASVVEAEGRTLVIARDTADQLGLAYRFVAAWITLDVDSELDDIGLTSVVAQALASAGISCNVIAGYHHDHLLVPHAQAPEALAVLRSITSER